LVGCIISVNCYSEYNIVIKWLKTNSFDIFFGLFKSIKHYFPLFLM
jgi:hypothetical protein